MKNLLCATLCIFLIFSGCKKYPQGPTISVWPRVERIEGKWVASVVKYNTTDSTAAYKNHIWEFTRRYSVILQVGAIKRTGIWSTVTNNNDLQIDYDDGITEQYEIIKMTTKELWLRDKKTQVDFQLKSK